MRIVGGTPSATSPTLAAAVMTRGAGAVLSIVLLLVYVPRLADLHQDHLASSVLSAALFVLGALGWVRGRIWYGAVTTMAGLALSLIMLGAPDTAGLTAVELGTAAIPLLPPLLAASVAPRRSLAAIGLLCGVIAGPGHAMLFDPYLDPDCVLQCSRSRLALTHAPGWASLSEHAGTWSVAVIAVVLVVVGGRSAALVASLVGAVSVVHGDHLTLLLLCCGVTAIILIVDLVGDASAQLRLRRMMSTLGSMSDLQSALRVAVGDDALAVTYELGADGATDAVGHQTDAPEQVTRRGEPASPPRNGQVRTPIRVDGAVVAWIHHGSSASDFARLAAMLNGPARLAIAVERLEAVTAVQSRRVNASRVRIVAAGDAELRRMERDIHDGAQQHVLSLGMAIETALIDRGPDDALRPTLEISLAQVRDALSQLRAIAHGLHPFSIGMVGLDTALYALARRSPNPVTIHSVPARRLDAVAERAVLALVQSAATIGNGPIDVDIDDHGETVELVITGVSDAATERLPFDRIAAAGGSLKFDTDTVTAVIPCAP